MEPNPLRNVHKTVVFQSTECGNDYIAYILNVDKDIVGNPLIACEKRFL
jgi:hypothetical protein